ncbi:MAG: hypothetical protein C0501_30580 [Isosphaera sp.]|nr:hypothetical protein [Isosphaera sp.]
MRRRRRGVGKPRGVGARPVAGRAERNPSASEIGNMMVRDAGGPRNPGVTPAGGEPVFQDTDVSNGRRFVADHGPRVRFVLDWKRWVVYDGRRWVIDPTQALTEHLAKETAERMAREAAGRVKAAADRLAAAPPDGPPADSAKREMKAAAAALAHAKDTQDMRALRRMLDAARSDPAVRVPKGMDVFDARNDLLNCPNGTVELRTGRLRPHDPADFLTRLCPTRYAPDAPRSEYLAFLAKVFDGRPRLAEYARALSGYAASGETCDHSFHVFHGAGANGKSVLTNLWVHVLGVNEYAYCPPAELLVGDDRGRHPTERVGLRGARLVVCSETREDAPLDEAKVKRLTSTDLIDARGMGQDFFFFPPTHKLVLATNHRPRLRGTDHGIRRRLRLVPFAVRFWKDADRQADPAGAFEEAFRADPKLEGRLKADEAEGILADMVGHARLFYAGGTVLDPPAEVVGATNEYLKAEDLIGQFFDALVEDDAGGRVPASELYAAFKQWAVGEGCDERKVPGAKKFGEEARRRFGWSRPRQTCYHVRLAASADPQIRSSSRKVPPVRARSGDSPGKSCGSADLRTGEVRLGA